MVHTLRAGDEVVRELALVVRKDDVGAPSFLTSSTWGSDEVKA
jgi:hypothetical protein